MADDVIRIPPQFYIHVLDNNSNLTRLEVGPQIFIKQDHEQVIEGPTKMINLQPRTYCKIQDPIVVTVIKNVRTPVLTKFKQVQNKLGDFEIRKCEDYPDPFPLFPGEKLVGKIENYSTILQDTALRLVCLKDFQEGEVKRVAGEEYQINGPLTYIPKVEEEVIKLIKAEIIKPNQALRLKAITNLTLKDGSKKNVGEEWLVRQIGSYLPNINEQVIGTVNGILLTDQTCLHLKASKAFTDFYGVKRSAGEEWLVTNTADYQVHIQDILEELVGIENIITLSNREYCVIVNPIETKTNQNQWGKKILKIGPCNFFKQPGEELESGIEEIIVLGADEALLLIAKEDFSDDTKQKRLAGEKWMINGPREYIPPVEIDILEKRNAIPLDENEGIYIRNNNTGEVSSFYGQTYMLKAHESLCQKELDPDVEAKLMEAQASQYVPLQAQAQLTQVTSARQKDRIVTYKAPHNSAVQIYNYKTKETRVVFGPDLIKLEYDEQISLLKLSGETPKVEGKIKTLAINLGPDFMTDIVIVETSDHAQLSLKLAYNWYFKFDKANKAESNKLFAIADFVGNTCKTIASRVRGAVSAVSFESFHHNSSTKIREAVFGKQGDEIKKELFFPANNLCVTSVDIQNVEITDKKTREYLSKSINLAIEITSKSKEAESKHSAEKLDQIARGQLERQVLEDQAKAEKARINLLRLQAESAGVASQGQAVATAKAKAESQSILGNAKVKQAKLKAQALEIESKAELEQFSSQFDAEYEHQKSLIDLEVTKQREMAKVETQKFEKICKSIGSDTLVSISKAGPEMKAKLLAGLGLKGYLVTDGKNPINLFNTANGFLGQAGGQQNQ